MLSLEREELKLSTVRTVRLWRFCVLRFAPGGFHEDVCSWRASRVVDFSTVRAQQPTQTQRIPLFENDDVKVWKSVIFPDAPLAMHRHEHPRVIVAMTGGTMRIVEQNGPAESHVWETGKAYWLPANPPNTLHADVNAGDKPIEVVVVELKKEN